MNTQRLLIALTVVNVALLTFSLVRPDVARTAYPETVLLRLSTSGGRPNVKLAATEDGASVQRLSAGAGRRANRRTARSTGATAARRRKASAAA